jgi:hypothetical protein
VNSLPAKAVFAVGETWLRSLLISSKLEFNSLAQDFPLLKAGEFSSCALPGAPIGRTHRSAPTSLSIEEALLVAA